MKPGSGLSLSVTLILAAMALALLTASCLGAVGVLALRDAHEEAARERALAQRALLHDRAESSARLAPIDELARAWSESDRASRRGLAVRLVVAGVLWVLLGAALGYFLGLRIVRPLSRAARDAETLARSSVEAAARDRDREMARVVKEVLAPGNHAGELGPFHFAGCFEPAPRRCASFWTYRVLDSGKLLLVIGAATGRGLRAALAVSAAKAVCDAALRAGNEDVTSLLSLMSSAVYQNARRTLTMACFASIIDPPARTITYANAGLSFPYLHRIGDDGRGAFGSLMIRGNRLGELKESAYESKTMQLRPGDTLIWYTPGILEHEAEDGEAYGEKRFRESIRKAVHLDVGDLRSALVGEVTSFATGSRARDVALIVGRVR